VSRRSGKGRRGDRHFVALIRSSHLPPNNHHAARDMNSLSSTIPIHILLESTSFPSPSSPTPATTLSDPSIHYHFTPTDGPLDPARYAGSAERAIIWDVEDGTVSSLSQGVITRGVRREGQGESAVWVVEAQEGWDASVKQDGGSE
jgi:hypothetical protein